MLYNTNCMLPITKIVFGTLCVGSLLFTGLSQVSATENEVLIQQLLQQISVLKGELQKLQQLQQLQYSTGFVFRRDLKVGDIGDDVRELQKMLNKNSVTVVATTGIGSAEQETMFFGGLTTAAVKRFQELYASEILIPIGLTAGTGYVGASTRTKLNQLASSDVISSLTPVFSATTSPRVSHRGGGGGRSEPTPTPTPTPISVPPTCILAFASPSLLVGASTKMIIKTTNAISAVVDQGVGVVATGTAVEKDITPTQTARYTLTVKNRAGVAATCGADMTVVPPFSRVGLEKVTIKQCTFPLVAALPNQTYYWFDKEYANINGESLRYDMAAPQVEGKYPLILLLHGGGFQGKGVTKTSRFPEASLRALAARGYVVATIEYSQATSSQTVYGQNHFTEAIKDLRCAVRYFRSNTNNSLRFIDTSKIGVLGTSAGGHLALLLGTSADETDFDDVDCPYNNLSARVQSVVALYPSTRFRPESIRYKWSDYKNVRTDSDPYIILGKQSNEVLELIKKGSPLYAIENYNTLARSYIPPILVINAGKERNLSLTASVHYLVDSLRQKDIPHMFFTEYTAYHGFDPFNGYEKSSCYTTSFLEQTLKH